LIEPIGSSVASNAKNPVTLGEKLKSQGSKPSGNLALILGLSLTLGAVLGVVFESLQFGGLSAAICVVFLIVVTPRRSTKTHFLISDDRHGFMKDLKLSDKTVVFDGSNIYHFGLENDVGREPLKALIQELRSEGYRIVCFFDANIYHTLLEYNAFQEGSQRFSVSILQALFNLEPAEIYVVPSGVQADRFIVETLSHLPISFAVTNDRFRDYEAEYDFLAKDKSWRKGVLIKNGKLSLYQHTFKNPLVM
jgi:hypothetical protein